MMNRVQVHKSLRRSHKIPRHKIRILLVDDHPSVLAGIRSFLKSREDLTVVGLARNAEEAVERAGASHPDVVILDLGLPDSSGLHVLSKLRGESQEMKFVVYTMHDGKEFLREALLAGANGFVSKWSSLRTLVHAIERVSCGKTYTDPSIVDAGRVTAKVQCEQANGFSHEETETSEGNPLTQREKEILRSLAAGLKLSEIAKEHAISFHTVVSHLRNIYDKLGVRNRSVAVAVARRKGII